MSKSLPKNNMELLRRENNFLQENIAEMLGVDIKTYRSWEKKDTFPSADMLKKMSEIYGVSIDFLLDISNCRNVENDYIQEKTGLSNDAIEMLKIFAQRQKNHKDFMPGLGADIDAINIILEYEYQKEKQSREYFASWSIFHYIRQYLSSGNYERERQDRLRIWNDTDTDIIDISENDTLIHDGKEHIVQYMEAVNSKSGSGGNPKTMHIYNSQNPKERYVVEVDKTFQAYSKDNIFEELINIKNYLKKKGRD